METQLDDIIRKIQDEGVSAAENRGREIIEAAEKQAAQRVQAAQQEAAGIIKDAELERDRMVAAGEQALAQAGRDLSLAVQKQIESIFNAVMESAVGESLSPDKVGEIVAALIAAWQTKESGTFEVLVPDNDKAALEKTIRAKLGDKIGAGVEVRPVANLAAGFKVGTKDGAVYYDFSAGSLAEMLSAFLNPRLGEIMKKATAE